MEKKAVASENKVATSEKYTATIVATWKVETVVPGTTAVSGVAPKGVVGFSLQIRRGNVEQSSDFGRM